MGLIQNLFRLFPENRVLLKLRFLIIKYFFIVMFSLYLLSKTKLSWKLKGRRIHNLFNKHSVLKFYSFKTPCTCFQTKTFAHRKLYDDPTLVAAPDAGGFWTGIERNPNDVIAWRRSSDKATFSIAPADWWFSEGQGNERRSWV